MIKLKSLYDTKEEIPEDYSSLYEEVDGKFKLTAIDGMKTQDDIDNVMKAKKHEVENRQQIEKEFADFKKQFDGIDPAKVRQMMEEAETKRLQKENPHADLDKIKLQKDHEKTLEELEAAREKIALFEGEKKQSTIINTALDTARALNFDPRFDDDIKIRVKAGELVLSEQGEVMTSDGKTVTDYLSPFADKYGLPSSGSGAKTPNASTEKTSKNEYMKAKEAGDIVGMMKHAQPVNP